MARMIVIWLAKLCSNFFSICLMTVLQPMWMRKFGNILILLTDALRISQLQLRATGSSEESSFTEGDEPLAGFREKWDAIENKSSIFLYGGGAIIAVWLSLVVFRAIDSVQLLPNLLELVGMGYSGWFVYRYLLVKENRDELASEIDSLKKRITGNKE